MEYVSIEVTAPPFFWTTNVTTQEIALSTKNGIFSTTSLPTDAARIAPVASPDTCPPAEAEAKAGYPTPDTLLNGQKSNRSKTNGIVTNIGLLNKPNTKNSSART